MIKMTQIHSYDTYELEIISSSLDGRGIGKIDGMTVFVEGAVEGDVALVALTKRKKRFAEGIVSEILTPSPNRIEHQCPHFGQCGGCTMFDRNYEAELKIKSSNVEQLMRRIGGFDDFALLSIEKNSRTRYRNKAVYKISSHDCGFFSQKSHTVIPVEDCLLCSENDKKLIAALVSYIKENDVQNIKTMFVRRSFTTQEAMTAIETEGDFTDMKGLSQSLIKAGATSVIINSQLIYGRDFIEDELLGVKFRISHDSFYQVNPAMTNKLYSYALECAALTGKARVLDIYCGIGTISLCAAKSAASVIGVEIVPQAVKNARDNAILNKIENAVFYADSAENIVPKLIESGENPDVVILDPPRKGSDPATLQAILKASPKRIVYVSCDPATLARDCKTLAQGGFVLSQAKAFDMFPGTGHVETCVLLSKLKSSKSVSIDLDLDALETTAAEVKATYGEIKEYILNKYGFKVSSLNIAQVKKECGIIERENFNKPSGKYRQPNCPKHKFDAIKEALGHFKMI